MYQSKLFKCNTLAGGGKVSCFLGTQEARGGEQAPVLRLTYFVISFTSEMGAAVTVIRHNE